VIAKPAATFDVARITSPTARLPGDPGKVTGGTFGNGAAVGDRSASPSPRYHPFVRQTSVSATDGSFTAVFDTSTLSAGNYTVT
jgi:hypothetical protein